MRREDMTPYANHSGNSGVVAYRIGPDFIDLLFKTEPYIYRYTHDRPGKGAVTEMQKLARAGVGLSGFVSTSVRDRYASRRPLG